MLPLQLLRIKITNKGKNISPVFCKPVDDSFHELKLAAELIKQFEESFRKRETRELLGERIALLESSFDDYKLVRGLYTLLERRCIFSSWNHAESTADMSGKYGVYNLDPFNIRKNLFEESSAQGYALNDHERKEIINSVASKIRISHEAIVREMWADLEENMVLEGFKPIEPEKLISWYNLSLMQTLLFNSTKLEFSVRGGFNWKRTLRAVKKLGLMYNLYYRKKERPQEDQKKASTQKPNGEFNPADSGTGKSARTSSNYDNDVLCSIDGPLSIFKLTDRYGTAIAKLLPSIIVSEDWSIKALIVRKTATLGKKIYEFMTSGAESPDLPNESDIFAINSNFKNRILEKTSSSFSYLDASFDSSVEQKFASKFEQLSNGWKLIREPDPLIMSNGKGFIPDFAFEKYGIRVYLEIVGFWTNDYLVRKIQKITDVMSLASSFSSTPDPSSLPPHPSFEAKDFFIAINMDTYVSSGGIQSERVLASMRLSDYIEKNRLIIYKNDNVPIKSILDHLRTIDFKMIERLARDNQIRLAEELNRIIVNMSNLSEIISLEKIAEKYDIPVESILQIIKDSAITKNSDYKDRYMVKDKYLIPLTKIKEIKPLLGNDIRYIDACRILAHHHVPEACYTFILHKIGYDILWHSMDINGASIKLHDSQSNSN
jgi:predicted nuclease of restriction endonuclease-like RecB superfamily